jgi:hypothetical protein
LAVVAKPEIPSVTAVFSCDTALRFWSPLPLQSTKE